MNLCFLGWGDHIHVERWAGYFARKGDAVTVISLSGRGKYPPGVRQIVLGLDARHPRWRILKLRYHLWRLDPDVVHVHWAPFAYLAAKASKRPLVVTVWGSDLYKERPADVVRRIADGLDAAHVVTCDSADMARRIREVAGVPSDRISIIQWGVDTEKFRPGPPDVDFLQTIGVSTGPLVFSPRHLEPVYNQMTVVEAFASVVQAIPDATLVMKRYGSEPEYERRILALIERHRLTERVRIVGTLAYERMADLYRASAVTVSVPLSDATPMSVLEAMACGSAPVVSDLPSLREWIDDGRNGYLVTATDSASLSERIIALLRDLDLRVKFADANRMIILARASQDTNMMMIRELYLRLRQRRRR